MGVKRYKSCLVKALDQYFLVRCAKCKGKGIQPGWNEKSCTACEGAGEQRLDVPGKWNRDDVGLFKCGKCRGSGITPGRNEKTCTTCYGAGALVGLFPRVSCNTCDGSGVKPGWYVKPCDQCSGTGSLWTGEIL